MKTVTRLGLGISMAVLAAGLVGCGGGSSYAPPAATAPDSCEAGYPSTEAAPTEPARGGGFSDAPEGEAPAAAPPPPAVAAEKSAGAPARRSAEMAPPVDRPGLGTEWGETRFSRIS